MLSRRSLCSLGSLFIQILYLRNCSLMNANEFLPFVFDKQQRRDISRLIFLLYCPLNTMSYPPLTKVSVFHMMVYLSCTAAEMYQCLRSMSPQYTHTCLCTLFCLKQISHHGDWGRGGGAQVQPTVTNRGGFTLQPPAPSTTLTSIP